MKHGEADDTRGFRFDEGLTLIHHLSILLTMTKLCWCWKTGPHISYEVIETTLDDLLYNTEQVDVGVVNCEVNKHRPGTTIQPEVFLK